LIVNADVTPTIVRIPSLERATQIDIVEALEKAYEASEASESKKRARAVILTNPVNPLGKCYSVHVLRKIRQFCSARGMHLISDEVYAMSKLQKSDDCTVEPFVSALAVNGDADAARVHVIWSMSKDFACSGIRMVSMSSTKMFDKRRFKS
jgi:aspartate/methionine/tyrosine aminotransferase